MKRRVWPSVLAAAVLIVGGMAVFDAAAEAQCLSESECDALKQQVRDFRDDVRPLREEARRIRQQARELPRGSEERRALRRQARELRREFRQTRREHQLRETIKAYRDGCKRC